MKNIFHSECPLCSSKELSEPILVKDHSISKETFDLVTCQSCQFTFTQNPPSPENVGPYYISEDYVSHSDSKKGLTNSIYHKVRSFMLQKKAGLVKSRSKGNSILDIGSGTGYFLNTMKNAGFKTRGVEINDQAREYSKEKFGLDVVPPTSFFEQSASKEFDVITLWHVLEHLYNLDEYMSQIKASLKDDGTLIIAVPNKDSFDGHYYEEDWAGLDVPRHLWHFTPVSMQVLTKKHGWEIKEHRILPFDSFYVALLSEKYKKNMFETIKGFLVGGVSWLNAIFNAKKASSVIYVLQKAA